MATFNVVMRRTYVTNFTIEAVDKETALLLAEADTDKYELELVEADTCDETLEILEAE